MRTTVLLMLVAVAGVSGAGCAADDPSELEVIYVATESAPLAGISVQLDGPGLHLTLGAEDFGTTRYATPHTRRIELPSDGELRATIRVFEPGGGLLAEGSVTIPVERDRGYGIAAEVGSDSPADECLSCREIIAFPLVAPGASPLDSLYLSWGSNSMSNPVID